MLPRQNRLTKKRDFDNIFQKGKGFKEGFLFLRIVSNKLPNSRFAFIISKKTSKKATIRNKIRRQLQGLAQTNLAVIKKGMDCVLVVLPGFKNECFQEMEKNIQNLFRKSKLIQ